MKDRMGVKMVEMLFTHEARKALMEGELAADKVKELPEEDADARYPSWPPAPATGTFKIDHIVIARRDNDTFRVTCVLDTGLKLAFIETQIEEDGTLVLDELDMKLDMVLR